MRDREKWHFLKELSHIDLNLLTYKVKTILSYTLQNSLSEPSPTISSHPNRGVLKDYSPLFFRG